jgi:hypothetical protein
MGIEQGLIEKTSLFNGLAEAREGLVRHSLQLNSRFANQMACSANVLLGHFLCIEDDVGLSGLILAAKRVSSLVVPIALFDSVLELVPR